MREPEEQKETLPASTGTLAYNGTSDGSGGESDDDRKDRADAKDPLGRVGTVLEGKYEVMRLLGEGGMGAVYEAQHKVIGRRVAVKFLRSDFTSDQQALQRFLREAQIAGSLGHGNICEVTDIGEAEGGAPYMLMPLLEGRSLAEEMNQHEELLGSKRVFDIIYQVLTGLQRAHDAGIVHRDLKPENIFLTCMGDREDFVKILDFGISKVDEKVSGVKSGITHTGMVLGTPHYMSPEQARGRRTVDHRTDIYAVGVLLYEMLSGVLPFNGESYNEIIIGICTGDLVGPRTHSEQITVGVERVIVKALARDPDERYDTARELKHALIAAARDSWMSLPTYLRASFTGEVPMVSAADLDSETVSKLGSETVGPGAFPTGVIDGESRALARPGWWKPAIGVGVAAVLAVALVVVLTVGGSGESGSRGSSPGKSSSNGNSAPTGGSAPTGDSAPSALMRAAPGEASGARSAATRLVKVRFVGLPPGGRVMVAGKPVVGGVIQLERSSLKLTYHVTAPGYQSASGLITPDRERDVSLGLKRLPPTPRPSVRKPTMARRRPPPRRRVRARPRPRGASMGRQGTQLDGDYDGDN